MFPITNSASFDQTNLPMHMRGPNPNGRNANASISFLFSLNHRSGLNSDALRKCFSEIAVAQKSSWIIVCKNIKYKVKVSDFSLTASCIERISHFLWFCFTALCDLSAKFAPLSQPIVNKTKNNRDLFARVFQHLGAGRTHHL